VLDQCFAPAILVLVLAEILLVCFHASHRSDPYFAPSSFCVLPDDETIHLFDARYMSSQSPLSKTKRLGGGIWRIKWHPYSANHMLVGAMHAGCRVLNFKGGAFDRPALLTKAAAIGPDSFDLLEGSAEVKVKCAKKFSEHESMVYGTDWLVCPHPTQNGYFEAAARQVASSQSSFEMRKNLTFTFVYFFYLLTLFCCCSCSFYDRSVYLWDTVF
jgi:hypothetical protein